MWSVCLMAPLLAVVGGVVVNTRDGALEGTRLTIDADSYVDVFYNIPYAKPPVGSLRFQAPVANDAWTGVRNATSPGPWCPQQDALALFANQTYFGEEDCLYLNVYTPKPSDQSRPLPVMVWIHGGGYFYGSSLQYNATLLAAKGVVVVTINYRLGALGFLSTEDDVSVGNYGLHDQVLALKWVRGVISAFNGDPQDVTIFGESAGSGSVSLLVESSEARGLFSKAIMESGVSLSPWAIKPPYNPPTPRDQARWLAIALSCDVTNSSVLVACLRTKDPMDILEKITNIAQEHSYVAFMPLVEGSFGQSGILSAVPEEILSDGLFNNVTVIRGTNKDEYSLFLDKNFDPDDVGLTMEKFLNVTTDYVMMAVVNTRQTHLTADRVVDLLVDTYVTEPGHTEPKQLRAAFIQLTTDHFFTASMYKEMQLYSRAHGKTQYIYRFSYRADNQISEEWKGVGHGYELPFVFGAPYDNDFFWTNRSVSSWTDADRQMSDHVITMWTNFAKYGNPTPEGSVGTEWLPWTQATPQLLDIGVSSIMRPAVDTPGIRLWNDVIVRYAHSGVVG